MYLIHTKSHNPQSLNEVPATPFADVIKSEKKKKKTNERVNQGNLAAGYSALGGMGKENEKRYESANRTGQQNHNGGV